MWQIKIHKQSKLVFVFVGVTLRHTMSCYIVLTGHCKFPQNLQISFLNCVLNSA